MVVYAGRPVRFETSDWFCEGMRMQVEVWTTVCDGCGAEDSEDQPVYEHKVKVDARAITVVDACESCWEGAFGAMEALLAAGRKQPRSRAWW